MPISNFEEKKEKILEINNFSKIKDYNIEDGETINVGSIENKIEEEKTTNNSIDEDEDEDENQNQIDAKSLTVSSDSNEEINEESLEKIQSSMIEENSILAGGVKIEYEYNIEYILVDDEKLVNSDNIIKQVDIYINNYNNSRMQIYKKNYKQLYQTYSNKNYIITTSIDNKNNQKIIVSKTDKTKKIVKELKKPLYLFYNENNNLLKLKLNISNSRTELLYKYEKLIAKINITPDEKKEFEKERSNFIEQLETYYIYMLYHKKINKINNINKSNIVLQKEISVFKDASDSENKILNSNIYLIDNVDIDNVNKYNSENLNQYNNIILSLTGKTNKDINKDKKILETIKTYIKDKNEIDIFTKSLLKNTDIQDNYINYLVQELP